MGFHRGDSSFTSRTSRIRSIERIGTARTIGGVKRMKSLKHLESLAKKIREDGILSHIHLYRNLSTEEKQLTTIFVDRENWQSLYQKWEVMKNE
jgi:hypothetical protein